MAHVAAFTEGASSCEVYINRECVPRRPSSHPHPYILFLAPLESCSGPALAQPTTMERSPDTPNQDDDGSKSRVTCNFLPTNPRAEAISDFGSTQSGSQINTGHDYASRDVDPANSIISSHVTRPLVLDSGEGHKDSQLNLTRGHGIAMRTADRPAFVHFRESIPVNDIGRHGRMRSITKPSRAWAKEMNLA